MKPIALLLFFSLHALSLFAQSYKELIQMADAKYEQKDYEQSTQFFLKAFKIEQKNPSHLYNGACAAALAGKKKKRPEMAGCRAKKRVVECPACPPGQRPEQPARQQTV